jgi:hypothetical protein
MNRILNSQYPNVAVIFYIGQMGGGISEPESSIAVAQNDPSMHMSEKSTLRHASAEQTK